MTTATELMAHPLADVFPMMSDSEYSALVEDIREHGLYDPIVIYEGKILDGRNRYRACHEANVSVQMVDFDGDDPLAFVVSHNLKRRHLNESQRAMVAAKISNLRKGDNRFTIVDGPMATSIDEAASRLNVSRGSVKRARAVQRSGVAELQEAVERGEVAVRPASVIAKLPVEEQREVVKTNTVRERASATTRPPQGRGYLGADKPFELNSNRASQVANRAYERFGTVMGGLQGYCDGLKTFDVRPVLAVAREDEVAEWLRTLGEVSSMSRLIATRLKEGN